MNMLARAPRFQSQQASLARAASLLSHPHSRAAAYRRLISTTPATRPENLVGFPRLALRPSISFHDIRSSSLPPRHFHLASKHFAEEKTRGEPKSQEKTADPTAEKAKQPEADSAKAGEEGTASKEDGKQDDAKEEGKDDSGDGKDGKDEKDGKKEDLPPPPPHGDKTPWEVFRDTMNTELQRSKEWNESTKAIASSAHQFSESESVRRARQAYEDASGAVSKTTSTVVKSTASAIGKSATWTWETPVMKGVRKAANATGDVVDKATKPIRDTEAYKNVKNVIDDGSSSRYGGWVEKEERRKKRELLEQQKQGGKSDEPMQEDPNAGTNITVHKDAAWKEAWRDFRDSNRLVQGIFTMNKAYQESDNPLVSTARSITDKIAGFFAENETAMVIKKFRAMDPNFQVEPFIRDLREYILPEVLDAYVKGDTETLKMWLSAAQYSVYEALTKQYAQAGLKSDGRILDIRYVDILKARILEPGDTPVFIITCRTQEVHVYRNAKTNELAAGMEDKVQLVTYAIGITRIAEDVNNPETRGWRLMEMQKSGRDWY